MNNVQLSIFFGYAVTPESGTQVISFGYDSAAFRQAQQRRSILFSKRYTFLLNSCKIILLPIEPKNFGEKWDENGKCAALFI